MNENTPVGRRTGIRGCLGCLPRLILLILIIFIFLTWLDNFAVDWSPKAWLDEAVHLVNTRPVQVPAETPPLSGEVAVLVDGRLAQAFYLIQRDPQFAPLAQLVLDRRIRIEVSTGSCGTPRGKACYIGHCPATEPPGKIVIFPELLKMNAYFLAGVMVHEMTHARNKLERSAHDCETLYLSDEMAAFTNQQYFKKPYERFGYFDYFDRQGKFHPYCLYWSLKKIYSQTIDDVKLQAPDNFVERHLCNNFNDYLTY